MAKHILAQLGALIFGGTLGAVMMPGCTIRIGAGSDVSSDTGGSAIPEEPADSTVELTPEEEAAFDAVVDADPQRVAIETAKASYVSYLLQGTIESQGLDPNTFDQETLDTLVEQYLPWATAEADAWIATTEPTFFSMIPYKNPSECADLFGCPYTLGCPSPSKGKMSVCALQDCGDGVCRPCPEWFGGFAKLFIKGWCSYVCMVGPDVVGSAGYIATKPFGYVRQFCIVE